MVNTHVTENPVLKNLSTGVALFDASSLALISYNVSFRKMTRVNQIPPSSPDAEISLLDFFNEDSHEVVNQMLELTSRFPFAYEYSRNVRKGNLSYFPAEFWLRQVQEDGAEKKLFMMEIVDISLQKSYEKMSITSAELKQILTSITDGLVVVDQSLRLSEEYSSKAVEIFQTSKLAGASLVDVLFSSCVEGSFREREKKGVVNYLTTAFSLLMPSQLESLEKEAQKIIHFPKDGTGLEWNEYSVRYSPVIENDTIVKMILVFQDQTELMALRRDQKDLTFDYVLNSIESMSRVSAPDLKRFLDECIQLIEPLEIRNPQDLLERRQAIFRYLHTIKGLARVFTIPFIEHFAHAAETGMSQMDSSDFENQSSVSRIIGSISQTRSAVLALQRFFTSANLSEMNPTDLWKSFVKRHSTSALELAESLGKQLQIEMSASEAVPFGRDLSLLERSIVHLIRNGIDHGIESPNERLEAGKLSHGTLKISLQFDGKNFTLECADDGRGIDIHHVVQIALDKGVLKQKPENVTLKKLVLILTAPNFSTKEEVSMISGRGVGLDAVSQELSLAGGGIEIVETSPIGTIWKMNWQAQEHYQTN